MKYSIKRLIAPVLLTVLSPFQVTAAVERGDELIQQNIEAQIADSQALTDTRIQVHVEQQLVILTGEVRLYEQKLVSERIAWTTTGVYEVDNEIRVKPKIPLSDGAIERRVTEIVVADDRFRAAGVSVQVNKGKVLLSGNFVGFSDPAALKHKVAEIEGVIAIDMQATFLARLSGMTRTAPEAFDRFDTSATDVPPDTGMRHVKAHVQNHELDTGSEPSSASVVVRDDSSRAQG